VIGSVSGCGVDKFGFSSTAVGAMDQAGIRNLNIVVTASAMGDTMNDITTAYKKRNSQNIYEEVKQKFLAKTDQIPGKLEFLVLKNIGINIPEDIHSRMLYNFNGGICPDIGYTPKEFEKALEEHEPTTSGQRGALKPLTPFPDSVFTHIFQRLDQNLNQRGIDFWNRIIRRNEMHKYWLNELKTRLWNHVVNTNMPFQTWHWYMLNYWDHMEPGSYSKHMSILRPLYTKPEPNEKKTKYPLYTLKHMDKNTSLIWGPTWEYNKSDKTDELTGVGEKFVRNWFSQYKSINLGEYSANFKIQFGGKSKDQWSHTFWSSFMKMVRAKEL
jgi:hypothetical protein